MATDLNERAARGQAMNLAVHEAVHKGKENDMNYILERYVHYIDLGSIIQGLDIEELKSELSSKSKGG